MENFVILQAKQAEFIMKKSVVLVMKLIFSPDDENYNPTNTEIVGFCTFFGLIIIALLVMKWVLV